MTSRCIPRIRCGMILCEKDSCMLAPEEKSDSEDVVAFVWLGGVLSGAHRQSR
jgi:hypothetical protein